MKKGWKITLFISVILLIGGGVTYAMGFDKDYFDYLDRKNYTKDYTSPIDGNDSFVLYNAQNEQFSVMLPKHFFILEEMHGTGKDHHEIFLATYFNPETKHSNQGVERTLKVQYNQLSEEDIEVGTDRALETYAFEDHFQKQETTDRVTYTGESYTATSGMDVKQLDAKEYGTNTFFSFMLEKKTNHSIEISYSLRCFEKEEKKCKYDEEREREIFKQLLESITFDKEV